MDVSLHRLHGADRLYRVEDDPTGFALVRSIDASPDVFNELVRRVVDWSGSEFVALAQPDGHRGYDGVYVLPLSNSGWSYFAGRWTPGDRSGVPAAGDR